MLHDTSQKRILIPALALRSHTKPNNDQILARDNEHALLLETVGEKHIIRHRREPTGRGGGIGAGVPTKQQKEMSEDTT